MAGVGLIPGSRAPLMMDVVALAILVVVPALGLSVWLARAGSFAWHKRLQLALSGFLALILGLFETEVRRHPWTAAAQASPYYDTWLFPIFYVHLAVAISASVLWLLALAFGLKRVPTPPRPAPGTALHRRLGRAAALAMGATALTGWTFFWVAFLA